MPIASSTHNKGWGISTGSKGDISDQSIQTPLSKPRLEIPTPLSQFYSL